MKLRIDDDRYRIRLTEKEKKQLIGTGSLVHSFYFTDSFSINLKLLVVDQPEALFCRSEGDFLVIYINEQAAGLSEASSVIHSSEVSSIQLEYEVDQPCFSD